MREKTTLTTLRQARETGQPIAMLTCYDYATAVLLEQAGIDGILVGDSLAQVVLGQPNTLTAEMDLMVALTAAVRRGAPSVYLVGDMPFLSYQVSIEKAITNAGRFLVEAGCDAVKLEVDARHLDVVAALARAGIPVMAHLGVRPQHLGQVGRFRSQGRAAEESLALLNDARRMVEAGACLLLLECITAEIAAEITVRCEVPVISCGSGPGCNGQVLVLHDVLGLPGAGTARFAKRYANLSEPITTAIRAYVEEVRQGRFPTPEHSYHSPDGQLTRFRELLARQG